jgi:hypothetical protein
MTAFDPADHGYYEKRPDSGIWYRPGSNGTYEPKICANSACTLPGGVFMAFRRSAARGPDRYCSARCSGRDHRTETPGYRLRHTRVERERGKASQSPCADGCGRQAHDWSQIHGTDGLDVFEHYVPRCRPCHKVYDGILRGEAHGSSKVTEDAVREILDSPEKSTLELADVYGVSRQAVAHIRARRTWKHLSSTTARSPGQGRRAA